MTSYSLARPYFGLDGDLPLISGIIGASQRPRGGGVPSHYTLFDDFLYISTTSLRYWTAYFTSGGAGSSSTFAMIANRSNGVLQLGGTYGTIELSQFYSVGWQEKGVTPYNQNQVTWLVNVSPGAGGYIRVGTTTWRPADGANATNSNFLETNLSSGYWDAKSTAGGTTTTSTGVTYSPGANVYQLLTIRQRNITVAGSTIYNYFDFLINDTVYATHSSASQNGPVNQIQGPWIACYSPNSGVTSTAYIDTVWAEDCRQ